jgi:ferredoxin
MDAPTLFTQTSVREPEPRQVTGSIDTGSEDVAFDVLLQRSGKTVHVPAGRSIFEVVREAGVPALGSCLQGVCGTCETQVIEGEVDHRDSVLDEQERALDEVMMICVSRCNSGRLTLDL